MNKTITSYKIWIVFLVIGLFYACSKSADEESPVPTPSPEITFPSTEQINPTLTQEGGSTTIAFTSTAEWTASIVNSRTGSWISVNPLSGPAGKVILSIKAENNDTPDERTATITLKSGTISKKITISQKQKDALTVTSSKIELEKEGGAFYVEVRANIEFDTEIKADWIHLQQPTTRGIESHTLTFTADVNDEVTAREGKITISNGKLSEVLKVRQSGQDPAILLVTKECNVNNKGGDFDVEIKANVELSTEIKADWIHLPVTPRGMETHTLTFTADVNDEIGTREGEIIFSNGELSEVLKVYQSGQDPIIQLTTKEYNVNNKGDIITVEVNHNIDYIVKKLNSCDWVSEVTPRSLSAQNRSFEIKPNTTYDSRKAQIAFSSPDGNTSDILTITQAPAELLSVDKKLHYYDDEGGDLCLNVTSNIAYNIDIEGYWITSRQNRASSLSQLHFKVEQNETSSLRKGTITLRGGTQTEVITVEQTAKGVKLFISQTTFNVPAEGGIISFYTRSATNTSRNMNTWISRIQTRGVMQTEYLSYSISPNNALATRQGHININVGDDEQVVTIIQEGTKKGDVTGDIEDFEEKEQDW